MGKSFGINGITTQEIIGRAGISKKNLVGFLGLGQALSGDRLSNRRTRQFPKKFPKTNSKKGNLVNE